MVITDVNQVVYQGDGVTTAFPFTFRIIDATDIKLLLIDADGAEVDIESDYFIDTVNNTVHYPGYAPGAEPPEADRPAPVQTGQRLVVYRELPITQEKDLGDKWPFYVIELALDKLTMILQQVKGIWDRCLKVSVGQEATAPDFDYTVPIEAGKTFRVKDDGTGFELTEDPAVAHAAAVAAQEAAEQAQGIAENARDDAEAAAANAEDALDLIKEKATWFDNVATMKAAVGLQVGMLAGTKGYYSINDGGSAIYTIRTKTQSDVDDGGSVIFLDNGNVAELITDGTVTPEQFGAYGDGDSDTPHDDTVAIQKAINKYPVVKFLKKTYRITDTITVPSVRKLLGCGVGDCVIVFDGHGSAFELNDNREIVFEDFLLKRPDDYASGDNGIYGYRARHLTLRRVTIYNFYEAFKLDYSWSIIAEKCLVSDCEYAYSVNRTINNNGTGLVFIKCGVGDCAYGYYIRNMTYSTMISCGCDRATNTAYYFERVNMSIIACGCENPELALHIYNYGSTLHFTNFFAYHPSSTTCAIHIEGTSRNYADRTYVSFDGLKITYADDVAKLATSFIKNEGTAFIQIKNQDLEPYLDSNHPTSIGPLTLSNLNTELVQIDGFIRTNLANLGLVYDMYRGQIFRRLVTNDDSDRSMGWICTRGGVYCTDTYNSATSYAVGNKTIGGGSIVFICIKANSSSDPHDTTDTEYWKSTGKVFAKIAKLPDCGSNLN